MRSKRKILIHDMYEDRGFPPYEYEEIEYPRKDRPPTIPDNRTTQENIRAAIAQKKENREGSAKSYKQ